MPARGLQGARGPGAPPVTSPGGRDPPSGGLGASPWCGAGLGIPRAQSGRRGAGGSRKPFSFFFFNLFFYFISFSSFSFPSPVWQNWTRPLTADGCPERRCALGRTGGKGGVALRTAQPRPRPPWLFAGVAGTPLTPPVGARGPEGPGATPPSRPRRARKMRGRCAPAARSREGAGRLSGGTRGEFTLWQS